MVLVALLDRHIGMLVGTGDLAARAPVDTRKPMVVVQQIHCAIDGSTANRPALAADIFEKLFRTKWLVILSDAFENGAAWAGDPVALVAQVGQNLFYPRHVLYSPIELREPS